MLKGRLHSFPVIRTGLRFPSSSNFSGAIMQSSLIGKTLLCAPVSTLHWRLIIPLLFWLGYLKCCKDFIVSSMVLTSIVMIVRISSLSSSPLSSIVWIDFLKASFLPWLNCFRWLDRQTDCQWLALPHFWHNVPYAGHLFLGCCFPQLLQDSLSCSFWMASTFLSSWWLSLLPASVFICLLVASWLLAISIAPARVNDLSRSMRDFWTSGFFDPQISWSKTLSLTSVLSRNWHFPARFF